MPRKHRKRTIPKINRPIDTVAAIRADQIREGRRLMALENKNPMECK